MADRKAQTSIGDAFRVALAAIIFAVSAQVAIAIGGVILVVAMRRGVPSEADLWRVVFLSCLPWAIVAFQTVLNAVRGIGGVFVTTTPPAPAAVKEDLRMIPVYRHHVPTLNGVDVEDLQFFIKRVCATRDWTQRTWRGVRMPSGFRCDNEYHRQMMEILKQAGFIIGHKPRSSGRLLCYNPDQIIDHLGLSGNGSGTYQPVRGHQSG